MNSKRTNMHFLSLTTNLGQENKEVIGVRVSDEFFVKIVTGLAIINKAVKDYKVPNPERNIVINFFEGKFNISFDGQVLPSPSKYAFKECELNKLP